MDLLMPLGKVCYNMVAILIQSSSYSASLSTRPFFMFHVELFIWFPSNSQKLKLSHNFAVG